MYYFICVCSNGLANDTKLRCNMVDLYYALYGKIRPVCLLEMDVANNFREFIREHNIPTIKKISAKSTNGMDNSTTGNVGGTTETLTSQVSVNSVAQPKQKSRVRKIMKLDENLNDYNDIDLHQLSPILYNNGSEREQKRNDDSREKRSLNTYELTNEKPVLKKKDVKIKIGDRDLISNTNDSESNLLDKNSEIGQNETALRDNLVNPGGGTYNYIASKTLNRSVSISLTKYASHLHNK